MWLFLNINFFGKIRVIACLGILFIGCSLSSYAQSANSWYLSKILNDNNGLPQNSIRSMYYDKKTDFLWLATEAGLVRYDGVSTTVFDQRDMPYLQSTRISNFISAITGQVIGCNMLGETFMLQHNSPEANTSAQLATIQSIGFRRGNIKSVEAIMVEKKALYADTTYTEIVYNRLWINDSTWFADVDSSIYMACNNRIQYRWLKKKGEVFDFFIARNEWLYAINGYGQGYRIDVASKQKKPVVVKSDVLIAGKNGFYYDGLHDRPLVIAGNEIHEVLFEKDTILTRLVAVLPKLPAYTTSIAFDKSGRYLFIGTSVTGLYIYNLSPFKVYTTSGEDADNNNYGSVLVDSSHIFTNRSVLFDMATGNSKKLPVHIGSLNMGEDAGGNIWYGSYHGYYVSSFSLTDPEKAVREPSTGGDVFITAFRSKTGKLWISTGHWFGYTNGTDMQPILTYPSVDYSFYFITETSSGELLGVNKSGIYSIDTVRKKIIPELNDSLLSQIRTIVVDSASRCWICTYGNGIFLYHLKTKKLTRLPVDDKGYLQYSHVFADDGYGNFLIPTNKGLFRLSKNNLLQIEANATTPLYYQYFDVNDGLLTNEFNGGCQPAFNRLSGGDIVFPALQGLVRVKVKELTDPGKILLYVDKIETRLNSYKLSSNLHFKKEERVQAWSLGFAKWDQPNVEGIFYRLDKNDVWQRLSGVENKIQLNELNGGDHVLEIKYQFGLQPGQFTTSLYRFYIERYYYETWWFWLAMLVLLMAIIYISIRIRSMQLKQKNIQLQQIIKQNTQALSNRNAEMEEMLLDLNEALNGLKENSIFKNRLISLLGHDMLVPLRFMAALSDHLNTDANTLSNEMIKENTSEIKNTATQLLYLGQSLIQWIKLQEGSFRLIAQNINLAQMIREIITVHKSMMAVKNNAVLYEVTGEQSCVYDPTFIKVILHNLLLNANKFTTDGSIVIKASVTEKTLRIQVKDTGTGMEPAAVAGLNNLTPLASQKDTQEETGWGLGYTIIIDFLHFANGKLDVQSEIGKGTSVSFSLPL